MMLPENAFSPDLPMVGPAFKAVRKNLQAILIAISACWLLVVGCHRAANYSPDFLPVYTGARCLLHGCNPYDTAQLDAQYFQGGGPAADRPRWNMGGETPVYPPSAFLVLSPLATLRLPVVLRLWAGLNGILLIACVVLIRAMVPPSSRWLVTILGSCYLLSMVSELLLELGNPGAFAISLLIIGTLLYLRGRYIPLATILLTLSLAVKPQIGFLIVLYLIFKRIYWRQAALAIAGAIVLFLVGGWILKSRPVSAQWPSDFRSNIAESEKPGQINDPRPPAKATVSIWSHATSIVSLDAPISVFTRDAKTYKLAGYVIFFAAMALWMTAAIQRDCGSAGDWLALAALSALTMLPLYHRNYDTGLLILALPAIPIIFRQRRLLGSLIIAVTLLHIYALPIQRRSFRALQILSNHPVTLFHHHITAQSILENKLLFLLSMRQMSLEILTLAACYLVAMFVIRVPAQDAPEQSTGKPLADAQSRSLIDIPA